MDRRDFGKWERSLAVVELARSDGTCSIALKMSRCFKVEFIVGGEVTLVTEVNAKFSRLGRDGELVAVGVRERNGLAAYHVGLKNSHSLDHFQRKRKFGWKTTFDLPRRKTRGYISDIRVSFYAMRYSTCTHHFSPPPPRPRSSPRFTPRTASAPLPSSPLPSVHSLSLLQPSPSSPRHPLFSPLCPAPH